MGENVERLGRLQSNRTSLIVGGMRGAQSVQRAVATAAVETVTTNVQKAARTEGFDGKFGMTVAEALTKIRKDLVSFSEYQTALNKAISEADDALQKTASGSNSLPPGDLSAEQQNTLDMASKTDSPVQVSPGVTMTPAQAQQYYLDQAAEAQEEEARKLAAALDARLQEIIDGMPTSDYDEHKPGEEPPGSEDPGGNPPINYPGVNGGGGGGGSGTRVDDGSGIDEGKNNGNGNGNDDDNTIVRPPIIWEPPVVDPPVIDEPPFPPNDPEEPRIDGNIGGEVPGVGPGGTGGFPGGTTGGGSAGSVGGGLGGVAGGAGLAGGAALANRLSGGAGLLTGPGGVGATGGAGGAGASGVVAQSGAANGGRGGAMAGGGAAGGGGRGDKRNRRRGQDLMAFEVEPADDEALPDIGSAGAAGRSTSEGREDLGW